MGENGLNYTKQNYSRSELAEKLINHLEKYIK